MRFLCTTLLLWISCLAIGLSAPDLAEAEPGAAHSTEHAEHHEHVLPLDAQKIHKNIPVTNSMVMVWLAVGLIVLFCRAATGKMKLVPTGLQNFAEWAVESLYIFLEGLMGAHLTRRTFWFFGSIFFFILVSNYLGLIPGVGTIGWNLTNGAGENVGFLGWLRGGMADINMTAAMAFTFAILWIYWAVTENGFGGVAKHIFAPKGSFSGPMLAMMIPIFLFVGVLEVVSIAIRPVALSFRLFGNIYGGEQTMEKLMDLIPKSMQIFLSWIPAFPFYFMELLVGFVQALVFTLLCAIFLKLICDHGDEHKAHH